MDRWRAGRGATGVLGALVLAIAWPAAPALARDSVTLCFERQEVLPWRTLRGTGLNFELLKLVAARLDLRFDYQSMPWKRCLEQLKADQIDGAFAVSFNPSRMDLWAYPGVSAAGGAAAAADPTRADAARADPTRADATKRMHIDKYVLIRRKGAAIDWDGKTLKHVNGAIGVQLGYSVGEFLRGMNVQVDEGSQRASELAEKLVAGRLAGAALGGSDATALMHGPLAARLEAVPLPLVEKPYFLVLSHAFVAARPELAARIWKGIEEARNSAAYKKLVREAETGHYDFGPHEGGRNEAVRQEGGRH